MPNNAVETSLEFAPLADSFFSNRTIAASLASILVLAITCRIVHCIWPMHLTSVLVSSITETENLYYDAIEAGELTGDVDTEEKLLSLQKKVSEIREDSLRNSLSAGGRWEIFSRDIPSRCFDVPLKFRDSKLT
ncbi:hypothetical protein C8J57DRAFT_1519899 [Mycena rebaudengoi]|nr:hypothetical protein C8J57DRAFT_1519899 [Mycena rebaudengoi]